MSLLHFVAHLMLCGLDKFEGFAETISLSGRILLHLLSLLLKLVWPAELILVLRKILRTNLVWIGERRIFQMHASIEENLFTAIWSHLT